MPNACLSPRPAVGLAHDTLLIGSLTLRFHRTLRLPDDGNAYPLPPSLRTFPIERVADHADRVPEGWRARGGVIIPMHQREALWLGFGAPSGEPMALKIAAGMRNALTGEAWDERILAGRPQDYVVVPTQPWLDGFNAGRGLIRQFVAMPLGMGYTAEGQLSGEESVGGIQLVAFRARAGAITPAVPEDHLLRLCCADSVAAAGMGLAAGGRMRQEIHPDPHGAAVWDTTCPARLFVHIVDAGLYRRITGRPAPETPISARTYAEHGLPWFEEYSDAGDIAPSEALGGLRSVAEKDAEHGFAAQDDSTVDVPDHLVHEVGRSFSDPVG
jgi:hypothetical protein